MPTNTKLVYTECGRSNRHISILSVFQTNPKKEMVYHQLRVHKMPFFSFIYLFYSITMWERVLPIAYMLVMVFTNVFHNSVSHCGWLMSKGKYHSSRVTAQAKICHLVMKLNDQQTYFSKSFLCGEQCGLLLLYILLKPNMITFCA